MQKIADNGTLPLRQQKLIAALMVQPGVGKAAAAAGISERCAYAMLAKPPFRAALALAQRETMEAASRRLVNAMGAAVTKLHATVLNEGAPPATQLQAAKIILEQALKLREILDFETRLSALEAKQSER